MKSRVRIFVIFIIFNIVVVPLSRNLPGVLSAYEFSLNTQQLISMLCFIACNGVLVLYITNKIEKEEKKQQKQLNDEKQAKKDKDAARVSQKVEQFESLIAKEKLSIEEYQTLVNIQQNFGPYVKNVNLAHFATCLQFTDIIEVSTLKRQLFWFSHYLEDVFSEINKFVKDSTSDKDLQPVYDWIKTFENQLEIYSTYKGYSALQKKIQFYNHLYDLAHPKEVEVK
jgi:hypothetical protein